uniref:Uncharacterized protein n=1 Tax=Meloidogyne enterolobii TaxID=390850 RepID=A0A6V7XHC2_MELEN|nr:unnamed protein product [Meloidogyne enterolobii]
MFCFEKSENDTNIIKGARVCRDKCFVSRNFTTGNVTQGCGKCLKDEKIDCIACKERYCNTEDKVAKLCWTNKNEKCKTKNPCYILRTSTNEVKKGCGKCPFHTCEECNDHLCNNQDPFYCFGFMNSYSNCNKSDCYIAKIEEKNGGVFVYIHVSL